MRLTITQRSGDGSAHFSLPDVTHLAVDGVRYGSIPTDSELAQAYQQGYQDGRRGLEELVAALRTMSKATALVLRSLSEDGAWSAAASAVTALPPAVLQARAALAKVAQPQPATKGE